jgi:hypothetical protein
LELSGFPGLFYDVQLQGYPWIPGHIVTSVLRSDFEFLSSIFKSLINVMLLPMRATSTMNTVYLTAAGVQDMGMQRTIDFHLLSMQCET